MPKEKKQSKATPKQVIDFLMEIIEMLPEAVKNLPADMKERKYWEQIFKKGKPADRVMEVLRELPAFTYMRPKKGSKAAWTNVFKKHMGLAQIEGLLNSIKKYATFTPCERRKVVYWRDAFGAAEIHQRVRPEESDEWLPNPHRGTTTFQRFQGEPVYPAFITADTYGPVTFPKQGKIKENIGYAPRTTLAYCRWPWAWLEPKKGNFNWKLIDNSLKAAKASGQTAQLRFQPFSCPIKTPRPYGKRCPPLPFVNAPEWLWDTGIRWNEKMIYTAYELDHNDPLYVKHFGDFIRAFGARYDGHPDLESIDVAYGGFWGESGGNTLPETAAKLADIYLKSFKKTQLMFMLGTDGQHYAQKLANKTGRRIGFRSDCIGDLKVGNSPDVPAKLSWNHTYDAYMKEIYDSGAGDNWKKGPVTMETCGNVATWVCDGFDLDKIIYEGYRYHTSIFMPKNVFYPEKARAKMLEFDKKIGYRFALRQILLHLDTRGGEKFPVEVYIDNVGCAPIYRPYKLALRFSQGKKEKVLTFKEDIRKWLPGNYWFKEEIVFPKGFERGEVKVFLGIVNEQDKPCVWFAIKGKLENGWHPVTSVEVKG
ncbi:MAG: DUF4832 domain-containing protein [Candidatus Firestonebacteria bacterium]